MNVLVFGDSLVAGLKLIAPHTIACHPGETTETLLRGFPNLAYYLNDKQYTHVVLIAGTNDLANDAVPSYVVSNLLTFHALVRAHGAEPIACTLIDDGFNTEYKQRAPNVRFCEFMSENMDTSYLDGDGVHLSSEGQTVFSTMLDQVLSPPS